MADSEPLDLSSPQWKELDTAYGTATTIPGLLKRLETEWPACSGMDQWHAEPFGPLWEALDHQGDVYWASYAAVPHVARIAEQIPARHRIRFVFFIASVEEARTLGRGPAMPENLAAAYHEAVEKLRDLTLPCFADEYSEADGIILLSALALGMKWSRVGAALMNYQSETECQQCGEPIPVIGKRPRY